MVLGLRKITFKHPQKVVYLSHLNLKYKRPQNKLEFFVKYKSAFWV